MKHIGEAIRLVRQAMNLDQRQLARAAGLSDSHISMIETGNRDPSWSVVLRICHAMGINIAMLTMLLERSSPEIKPFAPLVYEYILDKSQKQKEPVK